jgi:tripartite-type tricarboxylate transporter receptor subunit TctC
MQNHPITRRDLLRLGTAVLGLSVSGIQAAAADDFFAGRTIAIICGYPPGGGVDAGARLIAFHLPKFISGNPNVIVQNMPGAGGLVAANYLYHKAEPTGLVIGLPGRDWVLHPTLKLPGASFEALKYSYIGSTGAYNTFGWIRVDAGVSSLDELKKSKIIFGALTPNTLTASIPKLLAAEGFPLQVVTGYGGTARILQALEQGEVTGIVTNLATFARRPDLLDKTVRPILQTLPERKDLPVLNDIVSPDLRPVAKVINAPSATGMPLVAPPGVPPDRIAALRRGFMAMARDPAFQADAKKIGEPAEAPIEGDKLRELFADIISSASEATAATYKELTGQK